MRVLFIGTGDIGLPTLRWLLADPRHEVVAVVTQPDKPAGRKMVLTPPATKVLALEHAVPVLQPVKIRHAVEELRAFDADVAVVIAYGQILSRAVLDTPRLGCLNIHASLLPKYRGAAPIQAPIKAGDSETGLTIMFMDEGLDTGDMLLTVRTALDGSETGGSLHDRLAEMAPAALEQALNLLASGNPPRTPQDNAQASHVGKLTRAHGRIDWSQSAEQIARTLRAYDPWPGSHTVLNGATLKVFAATPHPEITGCPLPGTVLDSQGKLLIACGSGALALTELQLEGSKRLSTPIFLNGHPIAPGALLG
jgi:methionyl-tRNA formyltransferase